MFIIYLKFLTNRAAAPDHMAVHNAWIAQGFDDGVFQCVGSIEPEGGGAIIASGESREEIDARINSDPFVVHNIVVAEITEVNVKKAAASLNFLRS